MARKKSILIVDRDRQSAQRLFAGLVRAGFTVTDTNSADDAHAILKERSFDAAVVDVLTCRAGEHDLIGELLADWSHPVIIAVADFKAMAIPKAVTNRGAHHFLNKPVEIADLVELLSPEPAFSGRVDGVDLLEYIQFMLLTGRKTVVQISGDRGQMAQLFLVNGSVIHAVSGDVEGEEAFYISMSFERGKFQNLSWREPSHASISKSAEHLLLEAARKRDELE